MTSDVEKDGKRVFQSGPDDPAHEFIDGIILNKMILKALCGPLAELSFVL